MTIENRRLLPYDSRVSIIRRSFRTAIATDISAFEHLRPIRSALVILAALSYTFDHHDKRALLPIGIVSRLLGLLVSIAGLRLPIKIFERPNPT